MLEILLLKLPFYAGFAFLAGGFACFFGCRYASSKRDKIFKREAEKLLDAQDAERRRHTEMYSAHREIERRNIFDSSSEDK